MKKKSALNKFKVKSKRIVKKKLGLISFLYLKILLICVHVIVIFRTQSISLYKMHLNLRFDETDGFCHVFRPEYRNIYAFKGNLKVTLRKHQRKNRWYFCFLVINNKLFVYKFAKDLE